MTRKTKILTVLACLVFVTALLFFASPGSTTTGTVTLTFRGYTNDAAGKPIALMVLSNQSSRAIVPYMYMDTSAASGRYVQSGTMEWKALASGEAKTFTIPRSSMNVASHRFTVNYPKHNWGFRLWATLFKLHLYRLQNYIPRRWIELNDATTTD